MVTWIEVTYTSLLERYLAAKVAAVTLCWAPSSMSCVMLVDLIS